MRYALRGMAVPVPLQSTIVFTSPTGNLLYLSLRPRLPHFARNRLRKGKQSHSFPATTTDRNLGRRVGAVPCPYNLPHSFFKLI